jgi:hypothetical protein
VQIATWSPAAVSQKREYFNYLPETIGDLSLEVTKFGVWGQTAIRKNPPLAGIYRIAEGKSPNTGLVGWRRSADRTLLHTNSLLTANFTGNLAISGF